MKKPRSFYNFANYVLHFLTISSSIILVQCQQINVDVHKSELFVQKVSPDYMSWNEAERINGFHHTVMSVEGPDLPPWIFTAYVTNAQESSLFLYGVASIDLDVNIIELLVSFTSLHSYRSKYYKVIITVLPRSEYAEREIRLRISNVNIGDMLSSDSRLSEFKEIFENYFWPESRGSLYVTYMAESEHEGFRLPANPNDTSGVIIHLGSTASFSMQLYDLRNETKPLSKHCPSFHKRTTVEKLFRPKHFIVDWCFFKLVDLTDCSSISKSTESTLNHPCWPFFTMSKYNKNEPTIMTPMSINSDDEEEVLTIKENVPASPLFRTLVTLVIIPSLILSIVITCWLICIMCLQNSKLYDPYSEDYFESVFFICEDCRRNPRKENDPLTLEQDLNEALFHF